MTDDIWEWDRPMEIYEVWFIEHQKSSAITICPKKEKMSILVKAHSEDEAIDRARTFWETSNSSATTRRVLSAVRREVI